MKMITTVIMTEAITARQRADYIMKRFITITVLVISLMTAFASCEKSKASQAVSMYDLSRAMTEASNRLADMAYASSSDSNPNEVISNVAQVDYEQIDSFFISYAESGAKSADEIVVIAAKSEDYVQQVREQLQKHLDYRKALYKTYGAEQLPKLDKAKLFTHGIYTVLIVADDTDSIGRAFDKFIAEK